ncbi:hypothetical protein DEHRE_10625 [Dehalobacter restrictus DSM 9455]|uniref:Uncharacterized protein n=1 Tax=Dehalobacter restrictus (strain DSM 9455 / PER-K23) TaxID=871738 RepID=A0ABM5P9Z0_DEHRP|nr:hypothetical protein DEHRE_10625 [Dehalobacter restrictus DSM 9455]
MITQKASLTTNFAVFVIVPLILTAAALFVKDEVR